MEKLKKVYNWLKQSPEGRTAYRGIKTFAYTFIGLVGSSMAISQNIDWRVVVGSCLVASIGFATDKGIREIKL